MVQAEAEVLYLIRAPQTAQVQEIYERVCKIAQGAALMTETKVEITFDKACSNVISNTTLDTKMAEVFNEIGAASFNQEEIHFAEQLYDTLSEQDKLNERAKLPKAVADYLKDKPISDIVNPYSKEQADVPIGGSTDVGDVSRNVPTAQLGSACWVLGTPAHTWQVVSIGTTSIAQQRNASSRKSFSRYCAGSNKKSRTP